MLKLKKGFTLIELLIVIAIIAILAVIVLVAINPAKILQKSRDSQRFSDITALATAINLYLADGKDFSTITSGTVYSTQTYTGTDARKNNGTGWVPLDFTTVSTGAPISALPVDPTDNSTYFYRFGGNSTSKTYEIDVVFESTDNTSKHTADGGNNASRYEIGNDLTILGT